MALTAISKSWTFWEWILYKFIVELGELTSEEKLSIEIVIPLTVTESEYDALIAFRVEKATRDVKKVIKIITDLISILVVFEFSLDFVLWATLRSTSWAMDFLILKIWIIIKISAGRTMNKPKQEGFWRRNQYNQDKEWRQKTHPWHQHP